MLFELYIPEEQNAYKLIETIKAMEFVRSDNLGDVFEEYSKPEDGCIIAFFRNKKDIASIGRYRDIKSSYISLLIFGDKRNRQDIKIKIPPQ